MTTKIAKKAIKALFDRFAGIWGSEWTWRIQGHEQAAVKEWQAALASFSENQLDHAATVARMQFKKPPSIAEFEALCRGAKNGTLVTMSDAADIAELKLKRLTPRDYAELLQLRDLLAELRLHIYKTQNKQTDIVFCSAECGKHIFVNSGGNAKWICEACSHN